MLTVWFAEPVDCADEQYNKPYRLDSKSKHLDQELLLSEMVKDIANELDNRMLHHKILQNLCRLINADKSFLYLVEGDKKSDSCYLTNALADISRSSECVSVASTNTNSDNHNELIYGLTSIKIPVGSGIVGNVAKTGEAVSLASFQDVSVGWKCPNTK